MLTDRPAGLLSEGASRNGLETTLACATLLKGVTCLVPKGFPDLKTTAVHEHEVKRRYTARPRFLLILRL